MRGKSLLPLLRGRADTVHEPDEPIGYELAGNAALFKGEHKIVIDRGPVGDGEWHLFNFVTDPGETTDLKEQMPALFDEMMEDYRSYVLRNNPDPLLLSILAGLALLGLFLAWRGARAIRKRHRA